MFFAPSWDELELWKPPLNSPLFSAVNTDPGKVAVTLRWKKWFSFSRCHLIASTAAQREYRCNLQLICCGKNCERVSLFPPHSGFEMAYQQLWTFIPTLNTRGARCLERQAAYSSIVSLSKLRPIAIPRYFSGLSKTPLNWMIKHKTHCIIKRYATQRILHIDHPGAGHLRLRSTIWKCGLGLQPQRGNVY